MTNILLALLVTATFTLFIWLVWARPLIAAVWFAVALVMTLAFCGVCKIAGEEEQ